MNMSFKNSTNSSHHNDLLQEVNYIIEVYALKIISSIGVLSSLFVLIVLNKMPSKHSIYRYIICKFFWNLMFCATGLVISIPTCPVYCEETFSRMVIQWSTSVAYKGFFLATGIADSLLLLSRYFILKNVKNFLLKMSKKLNIAVALIVPIIFCSLNIFVLKIYRNENGSYSWTSNIIGKKYLFLLYKIFASAVENLLPLLVIIVISCFVVREYRCSIRKSKELKSHTRRNYQQLQIRFTRLVFGMALMTLISRLSLQIIDLFVFYSDFFESKLVTESFLIFLYLIACFIGLFGQSIEGIFLIYLDNNFRSAIRNLSF